MPAFFGMPGFLELLIIGFILLVPIVVVVIVLVATSQRRQPPVYNENLAPCPDCGHMVSRQATTCPQCGRPTEPQK